MTCQTPSFSTTSYKAPANGRVVATRSGLVHALASGSGPVVLEDGYYDGDVSVPAGCWLAAASLHGAVITGTVTLAGDGAAAAGLHVQPRSGVAAVAASRAKHVSVTDVLCDATRGGSAGVQLYSCSGWIVERVKANRFVDYGVFAAEYEGAQETAADFEPGLIRDVVANHVARPTPGSSNGRAEAGVWLGQPATVTRAMANFCGWQSFWTGGAASDCVLSDLHGEGSPVWLYMEHLTRYVTIEHGYAKPTHVGVNCEWNDNRPGYGASQHCHIVDVDIHGGLVGVYADEGTDDLHLDGVRFYGQEHAGIVDYLHASPMTVANLAFNDWRSGVPHLTTGHPASRLSDEEFAVASKHLHPTIPQLRRYNGRQRDLTIEKDTP